jgi:hypothetical protein
MSALFRVHYAIPSVQGLQKHQEDVTATSPNEAAEIIIARLKPRRVSINKVKIVREGLAAHHPYGDEHGLLNGTNPNLEATFR